MSPKETGVVRVGLLGCGTVGSQVARLLTEQHEDLSTRASARIELAGIAVRAGHMCAQPLMRRLEAESVVRASFAPYNTRDEIRRLREGVRAAQELFT